MEYLVNVLQTFLAGMSSQSGGVIVFVYIVSERNGPLDQILGDGNGCVGQNEVDIAGFWSKFRPESRDERLRGCGAGSRPGEEDAHCK